jgi:hypothetical protein
MPRVHALKTILCAAALLGAAAASASDWTPLFDGESLAGWTGDTANYQVLDGVLVCTDKGGLLYTEREYADFEMEFEFKLSPGANNGLGIRAARSGDPAYHGMELQMLDDDAPKYADLKPEQYHGSIYSLVPAKRGHLKPAGEWNAQRVVCVGDHVKVELNGEVIVDAWLDRVKQAVGRDHAAFSRTSGHIVLCGHGAQVEFRRMRIRDVAPPPPVPGAGPDGAPPPGFTALFNGRDLEGWRGLGADPRRREKMSAEDFAAAVARDTAALKGVWTARDGVIAYAGAPSQLCTVKDYTDFDLYLEWKIPPKSDSGVYLRGTPQVQIWDPDNQAAHQNGADKGSGALWNNKKGGHRPLVRADRPAGEWNVFLIRMVGERVSVWLNGQPVLDRVVLENYWEPGVPVCRTGPIELQGHITPVEFRNLFIRELPH